MEPIRGITVAVGEQYAYTLSICLEANMRHLAECLVVTAHGDEAVKAVASKVPGVRVFETDAFTRPDASGNRPRFNKGLSLEESFDVLGREGWILIWDADILFPDVIPFEHAQRGRLNGCTRRTLRDPYRYRPDLDWQDCPRERDGGPIGFFQLFHADDPFINGRRPWYDVTFAHAGGGDAFFMRLWPHNAWAILRCDCLHLGPRDSNWFGTDKEGQDIMAAFVTRNGWQRRNPTADRTAIERVGTIVDRVQPQGYGPSKFELPFVRRAQGLPPPPR